MKKNTLISAFLLTACLTINAQTRFGLKVGANVANQIEVPDLGIISYTSHPIMAFQAGVLMEIPISKKVFFQPNLLFSQKGESVDFLNRRYNLRNNYLDLPLNIGYKITPKFNISGGPYLGYLISSSISDVDSDTTRTTREGNFVYGFNANLAYELSNNFVVSVNYSRGTIYEMGNGIYKSFSILNNVWGFSLTKFFDKK
jgi:hypothetical protein